MCFNNLSLQITLAVTNSSCTDGSITWPASTVSFFGSGWWFSWGNIPNSGFTFRCLCPCLEKWSPSSSPTSGWCLPSWWHSWYCSRTTGTLMSSQDHSYDASIEWKEDYLSFISGFRTGHDAGGIRVQRGLLPFEYSPDKIKPEWDHWRHCARKQIPTVSRLLNVPFYTKLFTNFI